MYVYKSRQKTLIECEHLVAYHN